MDAELNDLEKRLVKWLESEPGIAALKLHKAKNGHFLRTPIMLVGYTLARNAGLLGFSKNETHNLSKITDEVFMNGAEFLIAPREQNEYHLFGLSQANSVQNNSNVESKL
ncbi:MAG TPA: hypothetical protein VK308_07895 [Pyrinomonadaceae bacterium]|nr:hypothetical protein [Pyrinomonadaceae bacterium]